MVNNVLQQRRMVDSKLVVPSHFHILVYFLNNHVSLFIISETKIGSFSQLLVSFKMQWRSLWQQLNSRMHLICVESWSHRWPCSFRKLISNGSGIPLTERGFLLTMASTKTDKSCVAILIKGSSASIETFKSSTNTSVASTPLLDQSHLRYAQLLS
jgi:hypothetical protein